MAFIAAPTLITYSNPTTDVSTYFSLNEEEHKDGPKVDGSKEIAFDKKPATAFIFSEENPSANFGYIENWQIFHCETVSPPPEYNS